MANTPTAADERKAAEKETELINGLSMTESEAKQALETAEKELTAAQEKVKNAKATLRFIQGNPRETARYYEYKVDEGKLRKLFEDGLPVYGVNDLFKRVITLVNSESGEEIKWEGVQISERMRKEGMKKLERYCSIQKESPRKFYIKAIKNMDVRDIDDKRMLKRQKEIAELRADIARSESETDRIKSGKK